MFIIIFVDLFDKNKKKNHPKKSQIDSSFALLCSENCKQTFTNFFKILYVKKVH